MRAILLSGMAVATIVGAGSCPAQSGRFRMDVIPSIANGTDGPDLAIALGPAGEVVGFRAVRLAATTIVTRGYFWAGPGHGLVELPAASAGFASGAWGVSGSGLIVGRVQISEGSPVSTAAAVLSPDGPTLIGGLGGTSGAAFDVNDTGLIVGVAGTPSGASHAFSQFWPSGTPRDLGTLGGASSRAQAVNNSGLIVGQAQTDAGAQRVFVATAEAGMLDLNSLIPPLSGWVLSTARGLNDSGAVVGEGTLHGSFASFVCSGLGGVTPVELPPLEGKDRAHVAALNNAGAMVGYCTSIEGKIEGLFRATMWVGGQARDLTGSVVGYSGPALEYATAINDAGQVLVSVPSAHLFARLTPLCPSDLNGDGFVTADDYDRFADAFLAGELGADFDGDGLVTGDDFDGFTEAFAQGC